MTRGEQTSALSRLTAMVAMALIVVALYWARDVFIPFSLAILVSFLLVPMVNRIERVGLGRVPSVLMASLLAFVLLLGVGWVVVDQFVALTKSLPQYQQNIHEKVESLRRRSGAISEGTRAVQAVGRELSESRPAETQASGTPEPRLVAGAAKGSGGSRGSRSSRGSPGAGVAPSDGGAEIATDATPVKVVSPQQESLSFLGRTVLPLFGPLVTAGIVAIFVIFMLVGREDLRNRLIRLTGRRRVTATTQAIDEAAHRVTRYLISQLLINAGYGLVVAAALYFMGMPNALLWGLLSMLLRFVPYLGVWIAAAGPLILSLAVFPGWAHVAMVAGLYLALELTVANAIEPLFYGRRTGVSPMAVLVAAVFWTWMWGAVGLLLSTPMTVCLVVMGKYVPQLEVFTVLFGDEPPLSPRTVFYQRLLSLDQEEAAELLEEQMGRAPLAEVLDATALPALLMTDEQCRRGGIEPERCEQIYDQLREILGELEDTRAELEARAQAKAKEAAAQDAGQPLHETPAPAALSDAAAPAKPVLCLPARSESDYLAGMMLAEALRAAGVPAVAVEAERSFAAMVEKVAEAGARLACVVSTPPAALPRARSLCRRLRERYPELTVVAAVLGSDADAGRAAERVKASGGNVAVMGLGAAVREISKVLGVGENKGKSAA